MTATDLSVAEPQLARTITWQDTFWVVSGVPAQLLISIGGLAAAVGTTSWVLWILSVTIGFVQCFAYAEVASLFPSQSGGASVYGAIAWVRYSKFLAPISVWCNWIAWSPVLTIATGIAGGYILTSIFPATSPVMTYELVLAHLDWLQTGLKLRLNAVFFMSAALLLVTFVIQHHGILRAANATKILSIAALAPLLIVGIIPLVNGEVLSVNLHPLVPMIHDATGNLLPGAWDKSGWTLMAGGMFIAGWSTYGAETAVCYTREFKNPKSDTFKAIFWSGMLCLVIYTIVPLAFQGSLGVHKLQDPSIIDGSGVAKAMASMVGGGTVVLAVIVVMLTLALTLSVITAMAGSSRTLYQGSLNGWFPKYLSTVNSHGAPTRAMWTDLCFNLLLLAISNYGFVLSASNVAYLMFTFLNLNAGWLHRIDNPNIPRPYRAPTLLLAAGAVCGFFNLLITGAGADIYGAGTLRAGLLLILLVFPIFAWRHYVVDKGKFPKHMLEDLHLDGVLPAARGFWLAWAALLGGALTIWIGYRVSR